MMKSLATSVLALVAGTAFLFADMTEQQIAVTEAVSTAKVVRQSPALDAVLAPDVKIERVAKGFVFTEGPMWHQGALWFSDLRGNKMYSLSPFDSAQGDRELVERSADGTLRALLE